MDLPYLWIILQWSYLPTSWKKNLHSWKKYVCTNQPKIIIITIVVAIP